MINEFQNFGGNKVLTRTPKMIDNGREKADKIIGYINELFNANRRLRDENGVLADMVMDNNIGFKCESCGEWFDIDDKFVFGDDCYCLDCGEKIKQEQGDDPDPNHDYEWAKHTALGGI
jgi:hypothetical protein